MILPPLFSLVVGDDGYRSLRAPWPFIRQLDSEKRRERHWWPLYGRNETERRRSWYLLWPLIGGTRHEFERDRVESFAIFPLYYRERRVMREESAANSATGTRYRRLWPLYSWQKNETGSRLRIP